MMRWIVESSLRLRRLVVVIAAGLLVLGAVQLRSAPVDTYPEFTPPHVQIQTEALGLSAAEVEQLITVSLEADLLNGVAWLDEIRSESVAGLSSIELIFEPGTDVLRARQMVQERLTQAHALPNVSQPPAMLQPLASTSRVMMVGLSSKDTSLIDMSVLARWKIKPRLMGVPGVANVAIWGQRERQLQVQVDPARLQDRGVSLSRVVKTAGNALWVSPLSFVEASTPGTGGFIDTPNQRLGIQHILPITTPADLAQVTLEQEDGQPAIARTLRLGDVAQVVEGHQPLIGDAVVDDGPGLMLVIEKFPEANTRDVTAAVETALDSLKPGLSGIEVDSTVFRPSTFTEKAVDNLGTALLIGFLLVLLVLVAFVFEWRVAVISLVTIPLSLVAAGLVLYARETTVNTMILAGLAVALVAVVDDAIVDVEAIKRRLRERSQAGPQDAGDIDDGTSTVRVIAEAAVEVRTAMLYATLVVALAAVPLYFLPGLTGSFSRPLVISYVLALVASMVVALTVTPALAFLLLAKAPLDRRPSPILRALQRGYGRVLPWFARRATWAYATVGVLLLAGLAVAPQIGRESLVPTLKETDLLIHWNGAPGTSQPAMNRISAQVSRELRALPGVRNVGAHVGRAITSDQVVSVSSGEIWVSIDPDADYEPTSTAIRDVVDGYPGITDDVLTYPEERLRAVRTGADEPIVVRVFGQDLQVLREQAEAVRKVIAGVDGVVSPRADRQAEEPTVEVKVDLAAARRQGVVPGEVRRAAATLLSGLQVGSLFEEQKVFDVVVWGAPQNRASLTSVQNLLIDTPSGRSVRLGDVASVRITANPTVVQRDAVSRYVDVRADVSGRGVGDVARDVERQLAEVNFPIEYHAELLGDYAERQGGEQRALLYALVAVIGIVLLLQAAFGSWRPAFLVFLMLPASLAGAVVAIFASGSTWSLGSLAGLVVVTGIAARNGIVLVRRYQRLEAAGGRPGGAALVHHGAMERLAPVVLAALAGGLALLPLVVFGDTAGYEVVHPLAVTVLGGLVTSTLLSLVILPVLYLRFAARSGLEASPAGPPSSGATEDQKVGMPMPRKSENHVRGRLMFAALALALAVLPGCSGTSESEAGTTSEPVEIQPVAGTDLSRLTLTPKAVERLAIRTAPARVAAGRTVVPYSAVLYDPQGQTWVYTSTGPGTYVRHAIRVDRITADQAVLTQGPPAGTAVVMVGAAELYGAEYDVGH
jgi:CzcA family heavy metal efflux pump